MVCLGDALTRSLHSAADVSSDCVTTEANINFSITERDICESAANKEGRIQYITVAAGTANRRAKRAKMQHNNGSLLSSCEGLDFRI